ncbi:hypothetical protein MATL_G00206820 [Megalops atlanticus]|uniref:Ras and Rab interactor 3 n=1 Tax=Megalops atlanticus TaxID=7932 RepID=A0A9D3PL04_MEGAT|nr:hypothetical protein MATL_G00206820 [Megalops atlanticus]
MMKSAVIAQETGPSSGVTPEPHSPTRLGIKTTLSQGLTPSSPQEPAPPSTLSSTKGPKPFSMPPAPPGPKPYSVPPSAQGPKPYSPTPPPPAPKPSSTSSSIPFSLKGRKPPSLSDTTPPSPQDLMSSSSPGPLAAPALPLTPAPASCSTPESISSTPPDPASSTTPDPSSSTTPDPASSTTPGPTSSSAPSPASSPTPGPIASPTPASVSNSISSPGPASSSSPGPFSPPTSPFGLMRSPNPGISVLEKLIKTCPVWLQLGMGPERANSTLQRETPGIFLVRKNPILKKMVLSVRLPDQEGAPQVQDLLIKEEKSLIYLEGSVLVFDDIFKLIAFYCVSRDILPFTLRLPQVIVQATKYEDMEVISNLGSDFWGSSLNRCSDEGRGCTRRADQSQAHNHTNSCEIELSMGNDRLWYVNPIFIEEYCNSQPQAAPIARSQSLTTPGQAQPRYKRPPPLPPRPHPSEELATAAKQGKDKADGPPLPLAPACAPSPLTPTSTGKAKQEVSGNSGKQPPQAQQDSSDTACPSAQLPKGSSESTGPAAQLTKSGSDRSGPPVQSLKSSCDKSGPPVQSLKTSSDKSGPGAQSAKNSSGRSGPPAQSPKSGSGRSGQAAQSGPQSLPQRRVPPVPPRRRPSEKQPEEAASEEECSAASKEDGKQDTVAVATLICIDDPTTAEAPPAGEPGAPQEECATPETAMSEASTDTPVSPASAKKPRPVPPPRKKRLSQITPSLLSQDTGIPEEDPESGPSECAAQPPGTPTPLRRSVPVVDLRGTDVSLYAPEGRAPPLDHDSYSTSSTEEEAEAPGGAAATVKRSPAGVLDKAKPRLSIASISSVFTSFMSVDNKLKKRLVELGRDRESYFGNLVRDYRAFTLETMQKHTSSTEMLQEIRLMMTQLKNYLIQSAELQALLEPAVYPEEKLEAIIESALVKCVLKPLREAVYSGLRDIHTRDESVRRLEENQQVVLSTTTTDLGVTTSVPEAPVMEKIQLKLSALHKEYSPEKKIALLLKTCKIIYESMSVGCPGKAHGVDDFLPVLMYVVARCNMVALLLDVEYMMELMDPALQLGEGSYYLTTTYGALEHIKNYDKPEVTRQLSLEIQDSINRWERRRTLIKARASRSSVQDFINVSFLEAGSNTKTLGARPNTTIQDLCAQCAEKFEVLEPESYTLCVLVDGEYRLLAPTELPLSVKSSLHHSEPRKNYYFVYRPGSWTKEATPQQPPAPVDSLI